MKMWTWNAVMISVMWAVSSCVEPYDPPLDNPDLNYLVVNGHLNASTGMATVSLGRTLPVKSGDPIPKETGATIHVESGDGSFYTLSETEAGLYSGAISNANPQQSYRLLIRTKDNRGYAS